MATVTTAKAHGRKSLTLRADIHVCREGKRIDRSLFYAAVESQRDTSVESFGWQKTPFWLLLQKCMYSAWYLAAQQSEPNVLQIGEIFLGLDVSVGEARCDSGVQSQ